MRLFGWVQTRGQSSANPFIDIVSVMFIDRNNLMVILLEFGNPAFAVVLLRDNT